MKKVIIGLVLLIAITLITVLWLRTGKSSQGALVAAPSNSSSGEEQQPIAAPSHAAMARVPAYYKAAPSPNTLPPTLSPELFTEIKDWPTWPLKRFRRRWHSYPVIATAIRISATRAFIAASNLNTEQIVAYVWAKHSWPITWKNEQS